MTSKFDPAAYKKVLKEASKKGPTFDALQDSLRGPRDRLSTQLDLCKLFGVPQPVSPEFLEDWNARIEPALNKAKTLPSAPLLKQLLAELKKQDPKGGAGLQRPETWDRFHKDYHQSAIDQVRKNLAHLRAEFPLGYVPHDQFSRFLASVGATTSAFTEATLSQLASEADLVAFTPPELPEAALSPSIAASWKKAEACVEFSSMLDVVLLHRPAESRAKARYEIVDRLKAGGSPVTKADVHSAHRKAEQSKDTDAIQAAQKFLGTLKSSINDDAALHSLILQNFTQIVADQLAQGKAQLLIRDNLVSRGVVLADASRLVAAVKYLGVSAASTTTLEAVTALLAAGQLMSAEQTHAAVVATDENRAEHEALAAKIKAARSKLNRLRSEAQLAFNARNFDEARQKIDSGLQVEAADEELNRISQALPPAPPHSLQLRHDGESGLRLSWGHHGGATFTVVRNPTHAPLAPHDGEQLTTTSQQECLDPAPRIGEETYYAVFATNNTAYSAPSTSSVRLLPPPGEIRAAVGLDTATLTWPRTPGAAGYTATVSTAQGSRRAHELQSPTITLNGLAAGTSYHVTVAAVYLASDGTHTSPTTTRSFTPRGTATAIDDLEISASTNNQAASLTATWTPPDHFESELWALPHRAEVPSAAMLTAAQLSSLGASQCTLQSPHRTADGKFTAKVTITGGTMMRFIPVSVTDTGLLLGTSVIAGTVGPVSRPHAERFGNDIKLSWEWPNLTHVVEARWTDANGRTRSRRCTHAAYQAGGGLTIANAAGVDSVSLITIARVDDEELTSPPVAIALRQQRRTLTYTASIKKKLFGNPSCTFTVSGNPGNSEHSLLVVTSEQRMMPLSPDEGRTVHTERVQLTEASDNSFTVQLPKLKSPFWVCLFPATSDDVELIAPPTSQLKG